MSIYDIAVRDAEGACVALTEYEGKVLLVVNTATKCGFTPQYEGLEALYAAHHDRGFEILDFPCNQFLSQAPGSDQELAAFCSLKYGTTFKTFARVDVNGPNADPLFSHLKAEAPAEKGGGAAAWAIKAMSSMTRDKEADDIRWNFTKFLVDRDGRVVARFGPTVKPEAIAASVEQLL